MLIAFSGGMGVGKTTAAEIIGRIHSSHDSTIIKFADPLYEIQEYIYYLISDVHQRPKNFTKDRRLLQLIGSNWGRETIDNNLWVKMWTKSAKTALKVCGLVLCDDIRLDNEAEAVKALGGVIIKITSNKANERIDTKSGIPNHSTELGISDNFVDYIIENNYGLTTYEETLCSLYERILIKAEEMKKENTHGI